MPVLGVQLVREVDGFCLIGQTSALDVPGIGLTNLRLSFGILRVLMGFVGFCG
jgi:hypothetical protein